MPNLLETWSYRQLVVFFVWRDLIVRYRQTVFGTLWLVLRPLTMTFLLRLVFQNQIGQSNGTVPYIFYAVSGYLCWQFMATSATEAGNSLINNITSINKVYYPRLVLPLSAIVTNLVEFTVSTILLIIWLLLAKTPAVYHPGWMVISLIMLVLVTTGVGCLFASLFVRFRDLKFVLPFFLQAGILFAPIGFSPTHFTNISAWLLFINPVTAPMELFRFALFGQAYYPVMSTVIIGLFESLLLLAIGLTIFHTVERNLADTL